MESITREIWSATQFLAGSTTKRIPYEVVYGMELALNGFTKHPVAVTTAIIQEQQFKFQGVPQNFYKYCEGFLAIEFEAELIQIALPEIYRHRPLYNVALYHELGHFIDRHQNLTELRSHRTGRNRPFGSQPRTYACKLSLRFSPYNATKT